MPASLHEGDRIRIGGGYDMEPRWLHGRRYFTGTVRAFIPGQNDGPAAVIELDESVSFEDTTGSYLVLELRYTGAQWRDRETVHVELCDFVPDAAPWQIRKRGKWVESHATYERIG